MVEAPPIDLWHYNNFHVFKNKVFGECFTEEHFQEKKRTIHQQEEFFKVSDGSLTSFIPESAEDTFYAKMVKNGVNYVVPRKFLRKMPFKVNSFLEVRLKKSDTQVFRLVTSVKTMRIPERKSKSFREFLDSFNPLENSNSRAATFLKMVAFSRGLKLGVCGDVGSGKNANLILLSKILGGFASKLKEPTEAVFWQTLLFNDYVNLDEISSWKPARVSLIEEKLVDLADESPDTTKHSLDAYGKISTTELLSKSVTFTFNPLSVKHANSFESRFANPDKILDRYPLVYLQNRVRSALRTPNVVEAEVNIKRFLAWFRDVAGNTAYFFNHITREQHGWSRDNNPFVYNNRYVSNTKGLLDVIDAYSESQAEFDSWMAFCDSIMQDYKSMRDGRLISKKAEVNVNDW